MRGLNIQRIVIEKEENDKLYEALNILNKFCDTLDNTMVQYDFNTDELNDLNDDINEITHNFADFLYNLGDSVYIEIEG